MNAMIPKVFISYSWAKQEKVKELADRLISNGIEVVIDIYDLKIGHDKYKFMEQAVTDPSVDYVLIVCDKSYADKANKRSGGVGEETIIISPEIYGSAKQEKFIPVIFEKDDNGNPFCPAYIQSLIHIDLSEEDSYEAEYEKLLRDIYKKPVFRKPALGKPPIWLEDEIVDLSSIRNVIRQIQNGDAANTAKINFLQDKAKEDFLAAINQYISSSGNELENKIIPAIDQFKECRDLFVDYCEALIYSESLSVDILISFFEEIYNELHDSSRLKTYKENIFEFADFIIWELFIVAVAILIHYERYKELHDLLVRPYFLRVSYSGSDIDAQSYKFFSTYFSTLESVCKKRSNTPKLFTLAGDILVKREKRPVLTRKSIVNADLVLYQLGAILNIPNERSFSKEWFPRTYVYQEGTQSIWRKLISKAYCIKIAPLFGAASIEEIKEKVKKSVEDQNVKYSGSWECAPGILSSIGVDEIGSLQ